jgi:hypothetical protein
MSKLLKLLHKGTSDSGRVTAAGSRKEKRQNFST